MKLKDIQEGMYIQIYTDDNIYQDYWSYGKVYIDFRGEERSIESFGKLIYTIYKFEELENIGLKLDLESQ